MIRWLGSSLRSLLVALLAGLMPLCAAQAQNPNDGFDPNADNDVSAVAVQPDGKILIGGFFTTIGGDAHTSIARLLPDGSVDPAFSGPVVDGGVVAIALQADGHIVIAGGFTQVGIYGRNFIARLNGDGSVDSAFDPNANGTVDAVAVQADGEILLGGSFTTLQAGTVTRHHIARLSAGGSVDATFDPDANNRVNGLAVQPDRRIVVVGDFTTLKGGATTRNHVARLNADGSIDGAFDPDANSPAQAAALQVDGKIVIGGLFTKLKGNTVTKNYIARLNTDGSVDGTFDPDANLFVYDLAVQGDGKILFGGDFTALKAGTATRNHVARVNTDGSVDGTFDPNASSTVFALAVQADDKVLLGGDFTTLNGGATARNRIARMNIDGSVDATLALSANNMAQAIAIDREGRILLGGNFTTLDGVTTTHYIARLRGDGSVDASFNPDASNEVDSLALQTDGKIVLGGAFTSLSGGATPRNHIARLDSAGVVDGAFDPDADGTVRALSLQPDGKIVIGGAFTTLKGGTVARVNLARLNVDGSVDDAFAPSASVSGSVLTLAMQADGKILVGGHFTITSGSTTIANLARLNAADGSLDTTFNPNPDFGVYALAVQPDGRIVIVGTFTGLGITVRHRIARVYANGSVDGAFDPDANVDTYAVVLQADGKILVGGFFDTLNGGATTRHYIARLNSNGSVDGSFDRDPGHGIFTIALAADGKVLMSGNFSGIVRWSTPEPALQSLTLDGPALTWQRSGAAPETALPPVAEFSVAGSVWAPLGTMTAIAGGWRATGVTPPLNETFYLRTRGDLGAGGLGGRSQGAVETLRQFYVPDEIFADGFQ